MTGPSSQRHYLFVLPLFAVVTTASFALAEEFRIGTRVYVGDADEPVSETTTLFFEGAVYDFLEEPAQVAVFRKASGGRAGRFILLSPEHQIHTEFTTEQLAGAMEKLRTWAAQQTDPFLQFAAAPQFKESFDPGSGKLMLISPLENYQVETSRGAPAEAMAEYREFLDWYARLNALLAGGPPPEPRLRLNAALARNHVVPLKVELKRAGEPAPIRAEHEFTWRLSRADMDRIDDVRDWLAAYRTVTNDEYLQSTRPQGEAK